MDTFITPNELAKELDVPDWAIRKWLRREYPRPVAEKKTKWVLRRDVADAVRRQFNVK